jgi:hypothetical protein
MDLTHIYRIFYPTVMENTFFSATHGMFSKTDHLLSHKARPNKSWFFESIHKG